jgi:hypothetical protein
MKKLILILLPALLALCDAADAVAQAIPQDTTSQRIEEVVVMARGRNRARKYFRRYVRKVPLQGWYTGYTGAYHVGVVGQYSEWQSVGEYERNHIPGDDANRSQIALFALKPASPADSVHSWQIQRYILLAGSIAEKAATLGQRDDAVMSYRGLYDGLNTFFISEPVRDKERGFDTRILVNGDTGVISHSESVSRTPSGVWRVEVNYGLFEEFIYPTHIVASFEQRGEFTEENENVTVEMTGITPRRFTREAADQQYWKMGNDPSKVLKKKVREKLLKMK